MLDDMIYPFPPKFVAAQAQLSDVFLTEAASLGISSTDAEHLFKLLPASVRSAPAVQFVLGPDWRYVFGKPFHLDGNSRGFGVPHQAPLVLDLVRATLVAEHVLTISQFRRSWWPQLDRPAKHLDAIVEMLAVANVSHDYDLAYEQIGTGIGSYRIDWLLKTKGEGNFLLEVKNRPGQSAQELMRIQKTSRTTIAHSNPDEPVTDFTALFKSTYNKFHSAPTSPCIQGVILFLGIKIPAADFANFFYNHLQTNLNFVAFGKEDKEVGVRVNIIATSPKIADRVLSAFGWREEADLMY